MKTTLFDNTWVILPAFNEARYIGKVLKDLLLLTSNVIVVDDGSSDSTSAIVNDFPVYQLRHRLNLGKGAALKTGCEFAFKTLEAKAVVFMDSDAQHNAAELEIFIKALSDGHDLIFGVRQLNKSMPSMRRIGNQILSQLVKMLFGRHIPDILSGYKAMTKHGYQQVVWDASDYGVELEIAVKTARSKLDFATVPIETIYHDMDRGMTLIDAVKILIHLVVWRITK